MDRTIQQPYNSQPLASCEAYSIGQETPTQTSQFPEIILEPLRALYSVCHHKRSDFRISRTTLVRFSVYNSGIVVEEPKPGKNIVNWFPIQNLYGSAGLIPDKGKTEPIVFRQLHEKTKKPGRPLFAMVVRQPGDDGRRVLMCHAFIVYNPEFAQQLVNATQYAYRNKDGWNHPVNDKEFLNAKLSYTLQHLNEDDDIDLERLKITTQERDRQLAQLPDLKKQKTSSLKTQRSRPASQKVTQSAPVTPRRVQVTIQTPHHRAQSVIGARNILMMKHASSRVPTQSAANYYQGFNTQTMSSGAGQYGFTKAASIGGYPMSRSSSAMASQQTRKSSFTANDYFIPASQTRQAPAPSTSHTTNGFRQSASQPQESVLLNSNKTSNSSKHSKNSQKAPVPAASYTINGFTPPSQSQPVPVASTSHATDDFKPTSQTQEASAPSTPRSHRVLASSEPQETINGANNGNGFGVMDWNDIVDESHMNGETSPTSRKHKSSKHHRPSKKTMEKYSHQNGDVNGSLPDQDHSKQRNSSSKKDSSYSITKMDDHPGLQNGFFQAHEHADLAF